MSYEVIARKWRPTAFDEVSGQEHVTTALRNAIRSDRVPHAVLLTGPRGVGKTTLARLLARCLNCEKGPTDEPCGSCTSCEEITAGRSNDVQEVDAASRTSVDDVRELIESIRYAPSPGKYRIFVVDEVHMLSTAAFNALLKTLEEPPPRSLFVFATTNPEKIPFTVVSRCQRYDLRRIASSEVVARLRTIAESEGVAISDASLLALARESEGSMRDSQTLLDQVIAFGAGEVTDESVAQVLDLIDRRVLLGILQACIDSDPAAALRSCADASNKGADPGRLARELVGLLRDLVVLVVAGDPSLVEGSEDEVAELRTLAERSDGTRLRRMFRALIQEQEDLAWAPQPMAVLEMAIVRLASMPAGDDVGRLLARLDALEQQLRGAGGGGASGGGGGGSRPGRAASAPRGPAQAAAELQTGPAASPPTPAGAEGPTRPESASKRAEPEAASPPRAEPNVPAEPAEAPTRPLPTPASAADDSPAENAGAPGRETASAPPSPAESGSSPRPPRTHGDTPLDPESDASGAPAGPTSASAPPSDAPLAIVYDRLRAFAQEENRGLFASLDGGRLLSRDPGLLRIEVPGSFHCKRLEDRLRDLETICERFLGAPTSVEIRAGGLENAATPRDATPPAPRREEDRRRKQAALNHPSINIALEELRGEIVDIIPLHGTRRPAGRPGTPPTGPEGGPS